LNLNPHNSSLSIKRQAVPGRLPAAWLAAVEQGVKRLQAAFTSQAPDTVVCEAAAARALASRYLKSDPGFAADLFAAADRHERLNGNES